MNINVGIIDSSFLSPINIIGVPKKIELVKLKKSCDNAHIHCNEICAVGKQNINHITQEYFNEMFTIFKTSSYNSCLSSYSNKKHAEIKNFIIKCSEFLKIPQWDQIVSYFTDDELNLIINNQKKISDDFIETMLNIDTIIINYGSRTNLINALLNHPIKIKSFGNMIMSMDLGQFSRYLNKMTKQTSGQIDNIITNFINMHKDSLKLPINKEIGIKIINNFINKPNIIKNIYRLISPSLLQSQKIDIFNKSISLYDKDLMFLLLENKDIVPNLDTINKLVEKCYSRPEGSSNSKQIADIIDLLCEYGLVISKQVVLKLLDHGCYVNNLEKHNIKVDGDILAKCANHSYYPYKFDIKPDTDILIKECSKHDNLNTIKKLKEFGGIFTPQCLEEACGVTKNGRVIKYLVTECGVKVSEKCLEKFQEAYRIDALDILMKKFKSQNPITLAENINDNKKTIELDNNSIMTVTPRQIEINKEDDTIEYIVKGKVKSFFELKKKTIKYMDLYQVFLKYLISNKLTIGNYFIISDKLSKLLKINYCTIISIDQIHNILTYFIDIQQ